MMFERFLGSVLAVVCVVPACGGKIDPSTGPASCATGFVPHASGFGCVAVVPPAACTGATRSALGQSACVPVGDCNAAFPPAGAGFTVDATLATEDATHFKTISGALAAAPSGATIAVKPGTYAEALKLTQPVTLVGQCPAQVIVAAPSAGTATVDASGADLVVSGMTLRGGAGVSVVGHKLTATDVVFDGNTAPACPRPRTRRSPSRRAPSTARSRQAPAFRRTACSPTSRRTSR
jgi:hypothetical protein